MGKTKSIVTDYGSLCFFCGKQAECEHHLLFGNGRSKFAEEDGLKVPACNQCHTLGTVTGRILVTGMTLWHGMANLIYRSAARNEEQ